MNQNAYKNKQTCIPTHQVAGKIYQYVYQINRSSYKDIKNNTKHAKRAAQYTRKRKDSINRMLNRQENIK